MVKTGRPDEKNATETVNVIKPPAPGANGYTYVPILRPSIFRSASTGKPDLFFPIQADVTGNNAPAPLYDGSVTSYAFGPTSFELNYERLNDRSFETTQDILSGKRQFGINQNRFIESPLDRDTWHVGMGYTVGKGRFNAAVDYTRIRNDKEDGAGNNPNDLRSVTFGYTHNVSENTSFYGSVTHTEYDMGNSTENAGSTSPEDGNINQVNVGIKHRF